MQKLFTIAFILLSFTFAAAHSGGLDSNGGHFNRKTGEYHYHRAKAPSAATKSAIQPSSKTSQKSRAKKSKRK